MGGGQNKKVKVQTTLQNQEIQAIRKELCLEKEQIHALYQLFAHLDRGQKGFLQLDDFAAQYQISTEDFVQLPYLEYFFKLIPKKKEYKVFFQQFVPSLVYLCLMDEESLLKFVFNWVDTDGDGKITRRDIVHAANYRNPKTLQQTFFSSCAGEIGERKKEESTIDFSQFRQSFAKNDFLVWPAVRFQKGLQKKIQRRDFWKNLYSRIQKSQYALKNNEKKLMKIKQKAQQLKGVSTKKADELLMNKLWYRTRTARMIATDDCLEVVMSKPNRKSCPYLKPDLSLEILKRTANKINKQ